MNQQSIRLGAEVRVCNATHSMHQHLGRYMGPAELPGLENRHRVCFDGKFTYYLKTILSFFIQKKIYATTRLDFYIHFQISLTNILTSIIAIPILGYYVGVISYSPNKK